MKNIHKLAAIDIGSNAVRLLITSIRINKTDTKFKKISLVRVPLRLGEDVFSKGKISDKKLIRRQPLVERRVTTLMLVTFNQLFSHDSVSINRIWTGIAPNETQ